MNNFISIILPITILLAFNACSSDSTTDVRAYISTCSNSDSFTKIETGDILKNEDINTTIKMIHNEDGSRYVCSLNGKAYIQ